MKRWMAPLVVGLAFIAVSAALASTYSGYKWQNPKRITVIDTTYNAKWTEALNAAVADWNVSPYVEFTVTRGIQCNDRYKVCVHEFNAENGIYYAHAVIWPRRGRIWYASVELNDWFVDFTKDASIFQRTMCHELGHVLGLSPSADPDSCMSASVPHPSAADFAELAEIYGR